MALYIPPATAQSKFNLHHEAVRNYIEANPRKPELYQGQTLALKGLRAHFAAPASEEETKKGTAIVVLPTGAGKSGIASLVPYALNASRVLVITPSVIITKQMADAFWGESGIPPFCQARGLVSAEQVAGFVERGAMCATPLSDKNYSHAQNVKRVIQKFEQVFLVIVNCQKLNNSANVTIDDLVPIHGKFDMVIVDEAHHYPAPTWRYIIDKFTMCKKVFLTATPSNRGAPILGASFAEQTADYVAYEMMRAEAVADGIIRDLDFIEVNNAVADNVSNTNDPRAIALVIDRMIEELNDHDALAIAAGRTDRYQGMILCRLKEDANLVRDIINARVDNTAVCFHGGVGGQVANLVEFTAGRKRFLVTCGKACEGYDNKRVSVVGVLRNVTSRVLFNQFVGRCVRKLYPNEAIVSKVISHALHGQRAMYESLGEIAHEDPVDDIGFDEE